MTQLQKLSKLPRDPRTDELFKYSVTLSQKEYELKSDFELALNQNIMNTSYAE